MFYGSDVPNMSGFPTNPKDPISRSAWNLSVLPKDPHSLLKYTNEEIPGFFFNQIFFIFNFIFTFYLNKIKGVTEPMLYVGMLFSAFCWHMEDNFLSSISYNHSGEAKVWYGAPGASSAKFEQVSRKLLPDLWRGNPLLMHQLVTMVFYFSISFFFLPFF